MLVVHPFSNKLLSLTWRCATLTPCMKGIPTSLGSCRRQFSSLPRQKQFARGRIFGLLTLSSAASLHHSARVMSQKSWQPVFYKSCQQSVGPVQPSVPNTGNVIICKGSGQWIPGKNPTPSGKDQLVPLIISCAAKRHNVGNRSLPQNFAKPFVNVCKHHSQWNSENP